MPQAKIPDQEILQQNIPGQELPQQEIPKPKKTKYQSSFIYRLIKTVFILVVVIIILLYLIFKFGLGGGGGSFLPGGKEVGSINGANNNVKIAETETKKVEPEKAEIDKPEQTIDESGKTELQEDLDGKKIIPVKFEMIISFESDPINPDNVKEFACNIERIDTSKKGVNQKNQKSIVCENMLEFEFALEKEIRDWRLAFDLIDINLSNSAASVVPVLNIRMNPFPGEGVFRKIEAAVRSIDPKISIMRSEN